MRRGNKRTQENELRALTGKKVVQIKRKTAMRKISNANGIERSDIDEAVT